MFTEVRTFPHVKNFFIFFKCKDGLYLKNFFLGLQITKEKQITTQNLMSTFACA